MIQVPENFQDYDDDDPEIERRKRRFKYWQTLKTLRNEYLENSSIKDEQETSRFLDWVEQNYGIRSKMFDGHLTDDYDIVDEKKYMIYVLKYGK